MSTPFLPAAWHPLHADLERLPDKLQQLLESAYKAGEALAASYPVRPTEVAFFAPLSALAHQLGVKHNTISTWFKRYPVLHQVLTYRRFTDEVTLLEDGEVLCDKQGRPKTQRWHAGAVWVVKLAAPTGNQIRFLPEYIEHRWRDLGNDIRRRRTVRQSISQKQEGLGQLLHEILYWTQGQAPKDNDCRNADMDDLLPSDPMMDIRSAFDPQTVEQAARSIYTAVGDGSHYGVKTWMKAVWNAKHQEKLPLLADVVARTLTCREEWQSDEKPLRSPARLLVQRCKAAGFLA